MASTVYRFGEFCLDPASRKLWRGDEEVSLPPKVFNCLVYLVENRDRAIEHEELITAVWGEDHYLSDKALVQAILVARRALDDSGGNREFIETVRGFGYRWAAPVEAVEAMLENGAAPSATAEAPTEAEARSRDRPIGLWMPLALLVLGALIAGALYLRRSPQPRPPDGPPPPRTEGEIALLLPVTVEAGADADHAWVRLGVMDLIAARLREAGQAMVPSDTVIALLRGRPQEPGPRELDHLTTTTGARIVLAADAQATGARWTVSLHSLYGSEPPLTAVGEAHDVLEAAHAAADRMAAALGLTPAAEPNTEPGLRTLLQRTEAALLAQQMDVARSLIEEADPVLREHPEIRFQSGRIEYYSGHFDTARTAFESFVQEIPPQRDPVLRARALNGLGAIDNALGKPAAAEPLLSEAARLLRGRGHAHDHLSSVYMNLGIAADTLGDVEAARTHYAQARRLHESVGDVSSLAYVDHNVGVLEARRGRYDKARRYFASAAQRHAATQDIRGELVSRASIIEVDLGLLDSQSAQAQEPRVRELLDRVTNANSIVYANLSMANLLDATGRSREAEGLVHEVLRTTESDVALYWDRLNALLLRADHAMTVEDDPAHAVSLAAEAVEGLTRYPYGEDRRAHAWLIQIRAQLALGRHAAAAEASSALTAWAERDNTLAPRVHAYLAEAALAATERRNEAARAAFERSLALAETGHVPVYVLRAARSYVPWLLGAETRDATRALLVADLLGDYTDQHFDAALLRLRVYHALGPASAWRTALARTRSLAGERQIPPELLAAP